MFKNIRKQPKLSVDDDFNESLWMHDVGRLLVLNFDRKAQKLGLTRAQWRIVALLRRQPGAIQAHIADLLDVEPITLTRMIDRLEAAGMVERQPDAKDRRLKRLFLTPQAQLIARDMQKIALETRGEALLGVSDAEHGLLLNILKKMHYNLSGKTPLTAPKKSPKGKNNE